MFPALMLLSAAVSAGGQLMAGIGAQQSAQLNAFNTENQKIMSEAQTRQRANDRYSTFLRNTSANIAFLASTRDIGGVSQNPRTSSVSAFLTAQKEIAGRDVRRSDSQGMMESL